MIPSCRCNSFNDLVCILPDPSCLCMHTQFLKKKKMGFYYTFFQLYASSKMFLDVFP